MRSFGSTLALLLLAAIACALAGWQWNQGNFDVIFGVPPTPVGQRLYEDFTPEDVKGIQINTGNTHASFTLTDHGWQATEPWNDRMDPRAAVNIINFTLGLRVEDSSPVDKIDARKSGLAESTIRIRLENADQSPLAKFKLGRVAPWKAEVEGMEEPVSTVFVQPHDQHRKSHVYVCTGDITALFRDELRFLRDHHPFYFNPIALSKIRIRSQHGDLTIGRESPKSPWRIVKPLDLPTDPKAMKALIEGLYELQAVKVADRSDVTLPTTERSVKTTQVSLTAFGSESETTLDIFPPESSDALTVNATVSDRPNTVFDLPARPEPNLVSLASLPLEVNELRDPTLTNLNVQSLRGIAIEPVTGPEIVISRQPRQPWVATVNGSSYLANEENLYALLKAVTAARVIRFESDAASDFSPWGLDRPILKLRFLGHDNQVLELRFGIDNKGNYFVNRLGTSTVMRVDRSLIDAIAVRPYEWKHSRLWALDRVNLVGIKRQSRDEAPLILKYNFLDESWQAERQGRNLSADLDASRANYLVTALEGLMASRWLTQADPDASAALLTPSLEFAVIEKSVDDMGDFTGIITRTLVLAPGTGAHTGSYFGSLNTEMHPFVIDRETYEKLSTDLFGR